MKYIKLQRHNDWGVYYLALPGKGLLKSFASVKNAAKIPEGKTVRIRWPDGSETAETVTYKSFTGSVSDHGHSYDTKSMIPGILYASRGLTNWIPLNEVEVAEEDVS